MLWKVEQRSPVDRVVAGGMEEAHAHTYLAANSQQFQPSHNQLPYDLARRTPVMIERLTLTIDSFGVSKYELRKSHVESD